MMGEWDGDIDRGAGILSAFPTDDPVPLSRRQFLARCGALGAAAAIAQLPGVSLARASSHGAGTEEIAAALRLLAHDTISGLVAFVIPGTDPYSAAQGVTDKRSGGIDALAPEGIMKALDGFFPFPDSSVQVMAAGFATGMSEVPMPGLGPMFGEAEKHAATLDRAFNAFTANDDAVPLSLMVALLLNFVATSVNPGAISGPYPSAPFANLEFAEKAEVLRRIEGDDAELVALFDGDASEPMKASASGLIKLLGGQLPAFAAIYSYSEAGVFDAERGIATERPLGWKLSRYAPGRTAPADGWNELKGYYKGHRKARPTRRRGSTKRRRATDA